MFRDYTLQQIADHISSHQKVELIGDPATKIAGLNALNHAEQGELSFVANSAYRKALNCSQASAVIIQPSLKSEFSGAALLVDNPYLGYATASELFDDTPLAKAGIHPSACVAESADVHPQASIGPNVVVGKRVEIGSGTVIGAGSVIADDTFIGPNGWVGPNVTIYHGVRIGSHVRIHSSAVIGADGFGFAPKKNGGWQKIYQIGGVVIGDNVEIGACTTIDRGALSDTIIEDGVILDDHVMIAHNVVVGENTAMAGYSGAAGSAIIGKNCIFAGRAGAVGHITLCDGVQLNLGAVITKSVSKPGVYAAGTHVSKIDEWRKNAVRFNQLNDLAIRLRKLEKIRE